MIENVSEFYCPVSDDQGTHFVLKNEVGDMLVHIAPARFLRSQEIRFNAGDKVEVAGAHVKFQGRDSMLARQIPRGDELILLRDHAGKPMWIAR